MHKTGRKRNISVIPCWVIALYLIFYFLPSDNSFSAVLHIAAILLLVVFLLTVSIGLTSVVKFGKYPYTKAKYNNIEVSFLWRLNGGGLLFANEFVRIVSRDLGKVKHVFEYCAGPGFIGFALLANNTCDRLTLADSNPKAIEAIKATIKNNNLQDKVTVYHADCLDAIPETEQWDLVVGNPPWYLCPKGKRVKEGHNLYDPGGRVHEKFYRDIRKFLKPDGSILFIEGGAYTDAHSFERMIKSNGLRIEASFKSVSFFDIFKNMGEYKNLNPAFITTLRFMLFIRETYFIRSKANK